MLSPRTSAESLVADEVGADDEGLGQAVRAGLDGVLQVDAPLAAVAEQLLEARGVLRGGDDQDVPDAGQQERGQRVIDHRLVVDRQQLLGDRQGGGVQPGAGAAGEDDAFAGGHVVRGSAEVYGRGPLASAAVRGRRCRGTCGCRAGSWPGVWPGVG